jgi:hypothetical protein
VSSTTVFFGTSGTSGVGLVSVGLAGGATTTLSTNPPIPGVAFDPTYAYWTDPAGGVSSVPLDGGASTPIVVGTDVPGSYPPIAVDGTSLYWATGGYVKKVPLSGGTVTILASGQGRYVYGLAIDTKCVYWTSSANGTVMKVAF